VGAIGNLAMKKMLVLAPRLPYPTVGGDRLRIYWLCSALSHTYSLTLVSFCETKEEMNMSLPSDGVFETVHRVYLPKYLSLFWMAIGLFRRQPLQVAYYTSSRFKDLVDSLAPSHEFALCHLIRTAKYLDDFRGFRLIEMTDAISLNYSRVLRHIPKFSLKFAFYTVDFLRLRQFERHCIDTFDLSILVSNVDKEYLGSSSKTVVATNGVDSKMLHFPVRVQRPFEVVFIGCMTSFQNYDACLYFCRSVLPLLAASNPLIQFKIVGRIKDVHRKILQRFPKVVVTGSVESVPLSVRGASVGVCPVRMGAGVQNKILEYMALGLPVVSSSIGLEGLQARDNEELLVADEPAAMVEAINSLCTDIELREAIIDSAFKYLEENHRWEKCLAPAVSSISKLTKVGEV